MKVKVLHVQLTENFGGIESLLFNVLSRLDSRKFQFDFIGSSYSKYQDKFTDLGAHVYIMPSIKSPISYVNSFNKVLNNNYDIVHFHKNSAANIFPILIAKFHSSHPKIVVHSHNSAPSISSKPLFYFHRINKSLLNIMADKKVACSNKAAKWMFVSDKNVTIIKNGINVSEFTFSKEARNKIREKYSIENKTIIFGNVGRFSGQKNQMFLIKIFNEILKKHSKSVLFLIGTGELEDKVKEEVKRYGISGNVYFLGRKDNVADYLSAIDAFIMPSLFEGLPIAAVEAQASGMNVFVSSAITREIFLTHNIYSFSLKENPKYLAEKILNIHKVSNRQENADIIKRAGYDLNDTVSKFQSVYREMMVRA